MSNQKINLLQMQKYFESQMSQIRTISDLELSEKDYMLLGGEVKPLYHFSGSENEIQQFMLSVVVYCTYSLIYGDSEAYDRVLSDITQSQYGARIFLQSYLDVFHSFDINTYTLSVSDLAEKCKRVTVRHAGIPNSEKNICYDVFSGNLGRTDYLNVFNEAVSMLPPRSKYIVSMFDDSAKEQVTEKVLCLIQDVIDAHLTRNELLDKYSDISMSFIDHCILWNEGNRYQIRFCKAI